VIRLQAAPPTLLGLLVLALVGGRMPEQPRAGPGAADPLPSPARACSLSPAQERQALDAFDLMLPVVFHARCLNCHGGVNPYLDPAVGRHLGGAMVDTTGAPMPDSNCQDCHGLLPGWTLPGDAMFFAGRSPTDLCMQFKMFAPGGGAEFVRHIEHEPGLPQFIKNAFVGDRALNTAGEVAYESATGQMPVAEPAPGVHGDFVILARNWANAIGSGWNESPECGCAVSGAWHGTITAKGSFVGAGMPGELLVSSHATVMLESVPTPSFASGQRVRAYQATGGQVSWGVLATGACRGSASGTFALDTLDVDGNPMAELRLENVTGGGTRYQPTTGSWPDRWSPIFTVQCTISGTQVALPMTNLLPTWWHYDILNPPESADPDRLRGSYVWAPGPGSTIRWEWDLKRQP